MKNIFVIAFFLLNIAQVFGQNAQLEGYAYEEGNRGYLNEVYVKVFTQQDNKLVGEAVSNLEGYFTVDVPLGGKYIVIGKKNLFFEKMMEAETMDKKEGQKVFVKMELKREPGYLFDITLAPERANEDVEVSGIIGAKIEIYNNTKEEMALAIESHPSMNFQYTFKKGNWYTVLIRAKDYFTKRLEAHVDIDGCILCFEGIGDLRPAVTDNLTEGNEMGTLLANIEMKKIVIDETIELDKIYYEYNSAKLTDEALQELETLINILRDNPQLIVEIGSHTDSRGDAPYNLTLSELRAKSVVDHLEATGNIDGFRVKPRGYGETKLVNKCTSFAECTEEEHAKNRRTELKVVGLLDVDPIKDKSLADIKEQEHVQNLLREIQNSDVIEIPADGSLPAEIQRDLDAQAKKRAEEEAIKAGNVGEKVTEVVEEIVPNNSEKKSLSAKEDNDLLGNELKENAEKVSEPVVVDQIKDETQEIINEDETAENLKNKKDGQIFPPPTTEAISREIVPVDEKLSGYFVQILHSSSKIENAHPALGKYQKVYMDEREKGGYSYLLGIFPSREGAKSSIENTLSNLYPDSFVVQFQNGKRVQ